jgi:hypothetical protein
MNTTTLPIQTAPRSAAALPLELIVWQGIALLVPRDWELLQFSRNPSQGRCAFADRYQFRLEFNWRKVNGPPDFERMLSDYSAQLEQEGMPAGQRTTHHNWHGLENTTQEHTLCRRWGRYFESSRTLIEVVFVWPELKDRTLESTILDSVSDSSSGLAGFQHWRAFGMNLHAGAGLELVRCSARPAHIEWTFQDSNARRQQQFFRRGFVSEWLHQPIPLWLRDTVGKDCSLTESSTAIHAQHSVTTFTGTRRRSVLNPYRTTINAAAWICPRDGRLYSVIQTASKNLPRARLGCCPEFQHS